MAMVPYKARDFAVAPAGWRGAISGRPAGAPVKGGRGTVKQTRQGSSRRQIMEACAERAWVHTQISASAPLAGGVVLPLNDMAQGTGNAQRINNQTRFVSIEYAGEFITPVTSGSECARFVLFKDTQPSGALPTATQLLCAAESFSCFNPDLVGNSERPRFVVLHNVLHTYQNTTPYTTTQSYRSPPITGRVPLDMTTVYEGNAGTYSDIQTNGLYLLLYTDTSGSAFNGSFCLKYLRM
jgi:hypothetical protein